MEKITLRQIDAALAVEMAGSICLAAKQMHVAQPSLSQQIAALEDEVGVRLFDRLPGGTFPTVAGQVFLDKVRHLSGEVSSARLASLTAASAEIPEITIGIQHSEYTRRVVAALGLLRDQHPQLRARLQDFDNGQALRDAIRRGTIDIGFGTDVGDWAGHVRPAFDVNYMLLVPAQHMLAYQEEVLAADVVHESWVESPALLRLRATGGPWTFMDNIAITASTAQAAEAMVGSGLGITLTAADTTVDPLVLIKKNLEPALRERVLAIALKEFGPLELAFINALTSTAPSSLPPDRVQNEDPTFI